MAVVKANYFSNIQTFMYIWCCSCVFPLFLVLCFLHIATSYVNKGIKEFYVHVFVIWLHVQWSSCQYDVPR